MMDEIKEHLAIIGSIAGFLLIIFALTEGPKVLDWAVRHADTFLSH